MTSHGDLGALSARRIGLIGLLLLLGLFGVLVVSGSAFPGFAAAAECTTCGEGEEPPIEGEIFETVTVEVEGPGSVSDGTETICSNGSFSPHTCEVEYELGEKVTLSATPVAGFTFLGWEGSGCAGTGTCSVTMSGPKSVAARFADKTPPPSRQSPRRPANRSSNGRVARSK